jgi:hypothetical protein
LRPLNSFTFSPSGFLHLHISLASEQVSRCHQKSITTTEFAQPHTTTSERTLSCHHFWERGFTFSEPLRYSYGETSSLSLPRPDVVHSPTSRSLSPNLCNLKHNGLRTNLVTHSSRKGTFHSSEQFACSHSATSPLPSSEAPLRRLQYPSLTAWRFSSDPLRTARPLLHNADFQVHCSLSTKPSPGFSLHVPIVRSRTHHTTGLFIRPAWVAPTR